MYMHFAIDREIERSSETSVSYITTRHHNPEDHDLDFHRHENLESIVLYVYLTNLENK
jgi:hypothetical protein